VHKVLDAIVAALPRTSPSFSDEENMSASDSVD
jgi:hypothetical protein